MESLIKSAEGEKTGADRHIDDFHVRRRQQTLRVGNAMLRDTIDQGYPHGLFKQGHGVIGVHPDRRANLFGGHFLRVMLGNEIRHLLDAVQTSVFGHVRR